MWIEDFPLFQKILIYAAICLFVVIILLVISIWLVFPIIFKHSRRLQRFMMFLNLNIPKNADFSHPEKHEIEGVVNFDIVTKDIDGVTSVQLGAWLILPETEIKTTLITSHGISTASQLLASTEKPVLLYLHGVACNRALPVPSYKVLRQFFLIVAVDHRGFGNSDKSVKLSELGVVNDCVQIFQWIKSLTPNDLFVWGHSLGAAIGVHTVRKLKEKYSTPMGLILESPFSTMEEQLRNMRTFRLFKCCGCLENCFLKPLHETGLKFESTSHIPHVDCPILIMHSEDDNVISYKLGKKLYEVARTQRNLGLQGSVTYHQFPPLGYGHVGIGPSTRVPQIIEEFIEECTGETRVRESIRLSTNTNI